MVRPLDIRAMNMPKKGDQAINQAQIRRDTGLRIAALRRPGETDFIPAPQDEIMTPGTVLIVVGLYHQVDRLAELAGDWD